VPALGLALAAAAVLAQTAVYLIEAPGAGREGGALDWLSVAAIAAVAVAAGLRAASLPHRRPRFALLAVLLAYLAIDDAAGLHERITSVIADWLAVSGRGDALFLLPYLPLLAVACGLLWSAAREAGRPARSLMYLGLALLAAGLAARVLAAVVAATGITLADWEKTLGLAAMHEAELAAWVLLASGLGSLVHAAGSTAHNPAESAGMRRNFGRVY
jgi:hypothetical protein